MKKKTIIYSVLLSLLAMIISYISTNLDVSVSGERDILKYWSAIESLLSGNSLNEVPEDVLFINVSYDKQLVERSDEWGSPVGNAAITDRKKLADLLRLIQSAGNYRYVLLDVYFGNGYEADEDSLLYDRIASMDRLVIPRHKDDELASDKLECKAAYADYTTTLKEDNFTKFPLLTKNLEPSLPLHMYSDLTGRTVKKWGPLFVDKSSLSRRVVFPRMNVRETPEIPIYMNMGVDLLDNVDEYDWKQFFDNKIIVIGSFDDDDIHLTYAGFVPGSVINYNVYDSLVRGRHRIPALLILAYFLVFFAMSLLMLKGDSSGSQSLAWVWAKLFVIYSVILTIVCIFVFIVCEQAHDVFITSTFFSIVDTCHRWINKRKKNA